MVLKNNVYFIVINISVGMALFFMRIIIILFLFLWISSFFLIGPTRPPLGVDALPRFYHKTSFCQICISVENVSLTVDAVVEVCLIVPDNWEVRMYIKNYIHFTFKYIYIFQWGVHFVFDIIAGSFALTLPIILVNMKEN